jgi:hypothetical protein
MKIVLCKSLDGIHIDIARALFAIGLCYSNKPDHLQALHYHKQSLQMRHILYTRSDTQIILKTNYEELIISLTHTAVAYGNPENPDHNASASLIAYRSKLISNESKIDMPFDLGSVGSIKKETNDNTNVSVAYLFTEYADFSRMGKHERKSKIGNCCNFYCLQPSTSLKFCAKCLFARYCSLECQKRHWRTEGGHQYTCSYITELNQVMLEHPEHNRKIIRNCVINELNETSKPNFDWL